MVDPSPTEARERAPNTAPSAAVVTVSYGPDRERCELLCRSMDVLAPEVSDHVIIVDRSDLPKFRDLEAGRRRVVATEDVLPKRVWRLEARRVGLRSNVFLQAGKPIRGWLLQQLVKLAICREVAADVIVHADSDVCLMRPLAPDSLVGSDGRVRLFRDPRAIGDNLPEQVRWHRTAEGLLGLDPSPIPLPQFITSLVPWRRENAVALLDFVDRRFRRSWMQSIASAWDFSEYIFYGRFVTDVLGDAGGQFATAASLCWDYWERRQLTEAEIESFLDAMSDHHLGVSITAKAGMSPASYAPQLERRWRSGLVRAAGGGQ